MSIKTDYSESTFELPFVGNNVGESLCVIAIISIVTCLFSLTEFRYRLKSYTAGYFIKYVMYWLMLNIGLSAISFILSCSFYPDASLFVLATIAPIFPSLISNTDVGFINSKTYRLHFYNMKMYLFSWILKAIKTKQMDVKINNIAINPSVSSETELLGVSET